MEVVKANELAKREMEDRKKMESAKILAESLSRTKSEFLAMVSHEIRTPLQGILGGLEFLQSSVTQINLNKNEEDAFNIIQKSSNHLLTIINNILDISRFEFGNLVLDYASVDLRECIKHVVEMFTYTKGNKTLQVTLEIDDSIPHLIVTDTCRLRQIFTNLVSNAQKFTQDNGHLQIHIYIEQHDTSTNSLILHFEFQDNGIGIPPEKCKTIFDAFSQADMSLSRRFDGLGLGLTICKRIVEALGGNIWVESEIGKGSIFHFTVPTKPISNNSTSFSSFSDIITQPNDTRPNFISNISSEMSTANITESSMQKKRFTDFCT
jgi:signal transduction histidine kinase